MLARFTPADAVKWRVCCATSRLVERWLDGCEVAWVVSMRLNLRADLQTRTGLPRPGGWSHVEAEMSEGLGIFPVLDAPGWGIAGRNP
jgi:hypothetical protein